MKEYTLLFNIRVFSIIILCIAGFGIRFFDFLPVSKTLLYAIFLFVLNYKKIFKIPFDIWIKFAGICLFFLLFNLLKGASINYWVLGTWLCALFVLSNYIDKKYSFQTDFSKVSEIAMYYSLLHIPIMILFSDFLVRTNLGMHPKTFLYLFYFNNGDGFMGFPRIQGLAWEPSCWNLLLNINLASYLYRNVGVRKIALNVIAIISIMSTTGLVVMVVVFYINYLMNQSRDKIMKKIIIISIFSVMVLPFVMNALVDKLSNTSGAVRYGDWITAIAVVKDDPLWGADINNLERNNVAMTARMDAYNINGGDYDGYLMMDAGTTSGFANLFIVWGLFLGGLILCFFIKSPLFESRKYAIFFSIAFLCCMLGTPIDATGIFYIFPLSTLLLCGKRKFYFSIMKSTNIQR